MPTHFWEVSTMPQTARFSVLGIAVALAFAAGRECPRARPAPPGALDPTGPEFRGAIQVAYWPAGAQPRRIPERYELTPYRIVLNDVRVFDTLDPEGMPGDVWRIDVADKRLTIWAVRGPTR